MYAFVHAVKKFLFFFKKILRRKKKRSEIRIFFTKILQRS